MAVATERNSEVDNINREFKIQKYQIQQSVRFLDSKKYNNYLELASNEEKHKLLKQERNATSFQLANVAADVMSSLGREEQLFLDNPAFKKEVQVLCFCKNRADFILLSRAENLNIFVGGSTSSGGSSSTATVGYNDKSKSCIVLIPSTLLERGDVDRNRLVQLSTSTTTTTTKEGAPITIIAPKNPNRFSGKVRIRGEIVIETNRITLNASGLRFANARWISLSKKGIVHNIQRIEVYKHHQLVTFFLPPHTRLNAKEKGILEIDYRGQIPHFFAPGTAGGGNGSYYDNGVVSTQFESIFARRAFPCHDATAAKALFEVRCTAGGDTTLCLNNFPLSRYWIRFPSGIQTWAFENSKIEMPPYLLCYVLAKEGIYDSTEKRVDGILHRCIAFKEPDTSVARNNSVNYSIETTRILTARTGRRYPWAKKDLIAVLRSRPAAMENIGLETYLASQLLYPLSETGVATPWCWMPPLEEDKKEIVKSSSSSSSSSISRVEENEMEIEMEMETKEISNKARKRHERQLCRAWRAHWNKHGGCGQDHDCVLEDDQAFDKFLGLLLGEGEQEQEEEEEDPTLLQDDPLFDSMRKHRATNGEKLFRIFDVKVPASELRIRLKILHGSERNINKMLRTIQIIGHEGAHQWYGDMVTTRWWGDLWWNEGNATRESYKVLEVICPEYKMWDYFVSHDYWRALSQELILLIFDKELSQDLRESIHPLVPPADYIRYNSQGVESMFDFITYAKGASLLRMMEQLVGSQVMESATREIFAKAFGGVLDLQYFLLVLERHYQAALKGGSSSTTATSDWGAQPSTVTGLMKNPLPLVFLPSQTPLQGISKLIESWFKQRGFPVLEIIGSSTCEAKQEDVVTFFKKKRRAGEESRGEKKFETSEEKEDEEEEEEGKEERESDQDQNQHPASITDRTTRTATTTYQVERDHPATLVPKIAKEREKWPLFRTIPKWNVPLYQTGATASQAVLESSKSWKFKTDTKTNYMKFNDYGFGYYLTYYTPEFLHSHLISHLSRMSSTNQIQLHQECYIMFRQDQLPFTDYVILVRAFRDVTDTGVVSSVLTRLAAITSSDLHDLMQEILTSPSGEKPPRENLKSWKRVKFWVDLGQEIMEKAVKTHKVLEFLREFVTTSRRNLLHFVPTFLRSTSTDSKALNLAFWNIQNLIKPLLFFRGLAAELLHLARQELSLSLKDAKEKGKLAESLEFVLFHTESSSSTSSSSSSSPTMSPSSSSSLDLLSSKIQGKAIPLETAQVIDQVATAASIAIKQQQQLEAEEKKEGRKSGSTGSEEEGKTQKTTKKKPRKKPIKLPNGQEMKVIVPPVSVTEVIVPTTTTTPTPAPVSGDVVVVKTLRQTEEKEDEEEEETEKSGSNRTKMALLLSKSQTKVMKYYLENWETRSRTCDSLRTKLRGMWKIIKRIE